jgi:tetratricopeptide (TPR) repeat protein
MWGVLRGSAPIGVALSLISGAAAAAEPCSPVVGELVAVEGQVEVRRADDERWQPAMLNDSLCEGDTIQVGPRSRAAAALINDAILRIDENTAIHLLDIVAQVEEPSLLQLIAGAFQSFSRRPQRLAVYTPYINATIEGTEFVIRVADARGEITVLEGVVAAENDHGRLVLAPGERAVAAAGEAPRPEIVVRPRDAVQWALYYPPILATLGRGAEAVPPDLPPALAEALRLAGEGEIGAAFAALEQVPEAERDARFHLHEAALLLSVGRVDEAQAGIGRALAEEPDSALAHALRAIISVVQNEREAALAQAQRAVELDPAASAPRIALSYAQQAVFDLEGARATLLEAAERQPDDPLVWARLAEVWLMFNQRRRAREAAERAAALAPDLQRTQVVLGFANLVEFRTRSAREAFERAIALDPADPMPRLGLGLAQIRDSELAEGRRNLEVAVGLDSGNALLRSYLGKAYFEERRDPLDAEQLAIAKELDPLDPTPYLYDAIRKQTENRPGEALADLQTSIELNDNRAVYRSRLALDQDRAARGTSLARVYDDLGFHELGVREASRSLTFDPTNAAAHRFLSDSYGGIRRREIARVSELLQAQMLQDININPVQPSIAETNLNIVTQGGPAEAGFNEFTPLFERNRAQLNVSGLAGNDETFGGEGVASALYDRFSISGGAFHFQTDGWRPNHDIRHNIYNVFFQAALTPEVNAQVELRRRRSREGDLALNFDPDDFSPTQERTLDQDTGRVGLRYSPTPNSDLLLSLIYADREEEVVDSFDTPIGLIETAGRADDRGYQAEGQYLHRWHRLNLTAGGAFSDFDRDVDAFAAIGGLPVLDLTRPEEITHWRGYLYSDLNLPDPVTWTLGLSYDDYEQEELQVDKLNPKFGVQWLVTDTLRLRGAVFRTVKPLLASNQTLEPTHVAGFNQLFDDENATAAWRYGVGLDWRPLDGLFLGAEATWRDMDWPFIDTDLGEAGFTDHDEQTHRVYLYWTPLREVALSAEVVYDRFKAERSFRTIEDFFPEKLETISVPLGIRYFHPSGLFGGFSATYVHQEVDRSPGAELGLAEGSDDFVVLDAAVGYRLPNRAGLISLEVSNLLDEDFRYQDDSFRESQDAPSIGPYIPSRRILGRITLNW